MRAPPSTRGGAELSNGAFKSWTKLDLEFCPSGQNYPLSFTQRKNPKRNAWGVLSNSWAGLARRRDLPRRLAGHRIFDETDNGRDVGTRDATANRLSKQRTDIDVAGRT